MFEYIKFWFSKIIVDFGAFAIFVAAFGAFCGFAWVYSSIKRWVLRRKEENDEPV